MKTPEKDIEARYGVKLGPSAADGVLRSFRIDHFRNGYLIKFPNAALFGSVIDDECFEWRDGEWSRVQMRDHIDSEVIRFEWLVWMIAREQADRGEKLTQGDEERLKLAVKRLEAWL